MKIRVGLLLSLSIVGGINVMERPAFAQVAVPAVPYVLEFAHPEVVAYLLDPQNNPEPTAFAPWPGVPLKEDLGPQASELFVDADSFEFTLPPSIKAVVPNETGDGLIIYLNANRVADLAYLRAAITALDQPNPVVEMDEGLVSFSSNIDDMPEPFASMVEGWDGNTVVSKVVPAADLDWEALTDNLDTPTAKKHILTALKPSMVDFKAPQLPQSQFRLTGAVGLQTEYGRIDNDSPLSFLVESIEKDWPAAVVPEVAAGETIVLLLPLPLDLVNDPRAKARTTFLVMTPVNVRPGNRARR